MKTKTGKRIPVNANTVKGTDGMYYDSKKGHISHFATCPNADTWRRKK